MREGGMGARRDVLHNLSEAINAASSRGNTIYSTAVMAIRWIHDAASPPPPVAVQRNSAISSRYPYEMPDRTEAGPYSTDTSSWAVRGPRKVLSQPAS